MLPKLTVIAYSGLHVVPNADEGKFRHWSAGPSPCQEDHRVHEGTVLCCSLSFTCDVPCSCALFCSSEEMKTHDEFAISVSAGHGDEETVHRLEVACRDCGVLYSPKIIFGTSVLARGLTKTRSSKLS